MIPVPIFSNWFFLLLVWFAGGIYLMIIWSIFLIVEPRCRASFRRHPAMQGLVAFVLLLPTCCIVALMVWFILTDR